MSVRAPVDTAALKRANPIADVAARYTELRRSGRALVGRCPLHADGRKPNFYVYEATASFYCYCCNLGGDVIRLVGSTPRRTGRVIGAFAGAAGATSNSKWEQAVPRPPERHPTSPSEAHSPLADELTDEEMRRLIWVSGTHAAEQLLLPPGRACPDHQACRRLAFGLWLRCTDPVGEGIEQSGPAGG